MLSRVRGYTLVELMITISVLVILLVVGAPSFSGWLSNSQVRTTADGIQSALRLAQAEAMRRNRQVRFMLTNSDPGGSSWTASGTGKNWVVVTVPIAQMTDPSTGTTEVAQFIRGAALGNVTSNVSVSGPGTIAFNSFGAVSGATGVNTYQVTRSGASHPLNVNVTPGGLIRSCDAAQSIATSPEGC